MQPVGQSIGMRLFAIRTGSLYEKLGLKNGDIILAVNENSLSDPAQAFEAVSTALRAFAQQAGIEVAGINARSNAATCLGRTGWPRNFATANPATTSADAKRALLSAPWRLKHHLRYRRLRPRSRLGR